MKLLSHEMIEIMKHLQIKYKIGFHKANVALSIYQLMLEKCDARIPPEQVEQHLLQLADTVIEHENKQDYFANYTREQLIQILTEHYDEGYKTEANKREYLLKTLGIDNLHENN